MIVEYTNQNASLIQASTASPKERPWYPLERHELLAFIAVNVYRGLHKEREISDYLSVQDGMPDHRPVREAISKRRYEQIERFLCVFDPSSQELQHSPPYNKVKQLSDILIKTSQRVFSPSTHLAVDEAMEKSTGRSHHTVQLPSKPIPVGFKHWVLAYKGYALSWLFHTAHNGKGPIDL